jgi:glyoxylase-like metal-dependent hydrolase (beta-lactamase superfamily II)
MFVDPCLDFDHKNGNYWYDHADSMIAYANEKKLQIQYILETHAHADHLTSSQYLKQKYDMKPVLMIGDTINLSQSHFEKVFNQKYTTDVFDRLVKDGEEFPLGNFSVKAIYTPGHTADSMSYYVDNAVFVGDTLFHPDLGTARCDFPNGSAELMWNTVEKLFSLPGDTRCMLCHDYPKDRDFVYEVSMEEQRKNNRMVKVGTEQKDYVNMRTTRDSGLTAPLLILQSLQVNLNAGQFPVPEDNNKSYLKIPLTEKKQ